MINKKNFKFILIVCLMFSVFSCGKDDGAVIEENIENVGIDSKSEKEAEKQDKENNKEYEKAVKFYEKKGYEGFIEFVNENKYFAVKDIAENEATPLLIAVKNGDMEHVSLFIDKGASFYEVDNKNKDIIDYALESYNVDFQKALLNILPKSFIENKDEEGKSLLIRLICNGADYELISDLIKINGNVNEADKNEKTSLMYAAQYHYDVRITKLLLDNGADINKKNNNEWTALMYAARYNPNPLVLEDLIIRGASVEPNSVGLSICMLAACNENPGVLFTLVKYYEDINIQTDQGKTALMYACENKVDSSSVKILLDNKADVNLKDNDGKTALMYGLQSYTEPEALYLLIVAGANTNDADNSGKTVEEYLHDNSKLKQTDLGKTIEVKLAEQNKKESEENETIGEKDSSKEDNSKK